MRFRAKAVKLRHQLFAANPNLYRAILSSSLHNYSQSLLEVGNFRDACATTLKAVQHQHDLHQIRPIEYRRQLVKDLAECLESIQGNGASGARLEVSELKLDSINIYF